MVTERARAVRVLPLLGTASLLIALGCAKPDLATAGGRVTHREVGFSIGIPKSAGGSWTQQPRQKRAVTFTATRGRTLSLLWRCGRRPVSGNLLARRLLGGLDEAELLSEGPEAVPDGGWRQRARVTDRGKTAHLVSVSRRQAGCDWDFVLVTPRPDDAAEATFDEWMGTFVPPPSSRSAAP